jgi:hypothetical protein
MQQTQCIGRIAKVSSIAHFGDGKHRFYIPYRCSNQSLAHSNCCGRCNDRGTDKLQSSGKFDHGLITEPIPDHSHMYHGKWYKDGCGLWGVPLTETVRLAEEQHRVTHPLELVPVPAPAPITIAPRTIVPLKRRKPEHSATAVEASTTVTAVEAVTVVTVIPEKQRKPRAKKTTAASVVLPAAIEHITATHVEKDMEEVYIDDYEVEHVKLSPFEHNDTMYYRDTTKNKLFEHIKGGFGAYVGRYDPYSDCIRNDIPDSDEE